MRTLRISAVRIAAGLGVMALLAVGGFACWFGWQDHRYAQQLSVTQGPIYALNERDYAKVVSTIPTYLCEKQAGMTATEALVRVMHATDATWVATATRSYQSIQRIEAPGRWIDFHSLVQIRRGALVELATATYAANERAVAVAASAQPRTDEVVVNALAADQEYRDLLDQSRSAFLQVQGVEKKVRRTAPNHYLSDKSISGELERTHWQGTLPLGKLLENATRPDRSTSPDVSGTAVAASPTADLTPSSVSPAQCR